MAKQSGMIAFAEQFAQAKVEAAQRLISQYMIDTLQMTLHQTEGWGYERIMRLTEAWQQTQKEYTPALNSNDPGGGRDAGAHGPGDGPDHRRQAGPETIPGAVSRAPESDIWEVNNGHCRIQIGSDRN